MGKIERQLRHGTVWSGRNHMSPLDGLGDAASRATAAQRRSWASQVVKLLKSPDIVVRTRAIAALNILPANPKTVLNTLLEYHELFEANGEGYPLWPINMADAIWWCFQTNPND